MVRGCMKRISGGRFSGPRGKRLQSQANYRDSRVPRTAETDSSEDFLQALASAPSMDRVLEIMASSMTASGQQPPAVSVIDADEDRDKTGSCSYRDDVFGILAAGPGFAKLGIIWSEDGSISRKKREWSLSFSMLDSCSVEVVRRSPEGQSTEPPYWSHRKQRLWGALCDAKVMLRLERTKKGISCEREPHSDKIKIAFCAQAKSHLPLEALLAIGLKKLGVNRQRPDLLSSFAAESYVKPCALTLVEALRSEQNDSSGPCGEAQRSGPSSSSKARPCGKDERGKTARTGRESPEGTAGEDEDHDDEEFEEIDGVEEVQDQEDEEETTDGEDSSSAGSEGAIPILEVAWRAESKLTRKLFRIIGAGNAEDVEMLLSPVGTVHASATAVAHCVICSQPYSHDEKVVLFSCHASSGCAAVFHSWCCRRWRGQRSFDVKCPLCRHGVLDAATFPSINLDALDGDGFGALHHACYSNSNPTVVAVLIKWGCNVHQHNQPFKESPLHMAAIYRHPKQMKLLLDARARADALDYQGNTPLMRLQGKTMMSDWLTRDQNATAQCIALLEAEAISPASLALSKQRREDGNAAFMRKDFYQAAALYSESIEAHGVDATAFANRAAAWLELAKIPSGTSERQEMYVRCMRDSAMCISLDETNEKGHYRHILANMGTKDFMYAFAAAKRGVKNCPGSAPLRKLLLQLQACGLQERTANPMKAPEARRRAMQLVEQGHPSTMCVWCRAAVPLCMQETVCPHCLCDLSGPGTGEIPKKYGVEWASPQESVEIARAHDLEAGIEASLQEAAERAAEENAPLNDAILRSRPVDGDRVAVITFSRSGRNYRQALMEGPELEDCRRSLEDAGFSPELPSGAKVFVRPEQYEAVIEQLQSLDLKPRHVVVAEEFEELLLSVINGLPSSDQIRRKGPAAELVLGTSADSGPPMPSAQSEESQAPRGSMEEEEMDVTGLVHEIRRTFIHIKIQSSIYSGPSSGAKTASTSDANPRSPINPRRH